MSTQITLMGAKEWLMLIVLSLFWGGSFFFVGIAVEALPPFTIVALRVFLAAVTLTAIVYLSGLRLPGDMWIWRAFLGMGVLNNVIPFCLIVWGQTHIASGLASILNGTTPLFGVLAAHFLTRDERMTGAKLLGVALGFFGVIVMTGREALNGLGSNILAQLAVLGAAVSYALAGIYGRRFRQYGVKPIITATGQVMASTLILIPIALIVDKPLTLSMPGISVWFAIAGLAIISTALAYILYFRILSTSGATNVLLVTLLIPVSAILLGSTFLGEQLEPNHYLGMGFISIGLLSIDGRVMSMVMKRATVQVTKQ